MFSYKESGKWIHTNGWISKYILGNELLIEIYCRPVDKHDLYFGYHFMWLREIWKTTYGSLTIMGSQKDAKDKIDNFLRKIEKLAAFY